MIRAIPRIYFAYEGRSLFFFILGQYIYFSLCVEIYNYFTPLYIFLSTNLDHKLSLALIREKRGFTNFFGLLNDVAHQLK